MVEDRAIKIIVVGDESCGKTSLLKSYCKNEYQDEYIPTILDNYEVYIELDENRYKLFIYDTSGNEDLARLRPLTYDKADVVLICFSLVSGINLQSYVDKWLHKVKLYCPEAVILLVGCKNDIRRHEVRGTADQALGRKLAVEIKSAGYVECSAKLNRGIKELFEVAIKSVTGSKLRRNTDYDCVQKVHASNEFRYPFQEELEDLLSKNKMHQNNKQLSTCDRCYETSQKVIELTKRVDVMMKQIFVLENRIDAIEMKPVRCNKELVENCLSDFSSGLTMNSLNKISDTLTTLERLSLPDLEKLSAFPESGKISAENDSKKTSRSFVINDNITNSILLSSDPANFETFPAKNPKNASLSTDMVKKVLDNQSQLSSLICTGLEEKPNQNDLRIIKNFAFLLRLSPNSILSCSRLESAYSFKNPRDLKIRFVSPEAAVDFLTMPKAAICCSQLKYKNISFSRPLSIDQEKEADDLLSSFRHITKN